MARIYCHCLVDGSSSAYVSDPAHLLILSVGKGDPFEISPAVFLPAPASICVSTDYVMSDIIISSFFSCVIQVKPNIVP